MKNAFAVAFFVMKLLFKQKLTPIFVFGAIFALVAAISISSVDIGVRFKLLCDLLLASSGFLLHASLFFYAFTLMQKHREGGLFLLFLTNGAKRWEYLLGLFYGIAFIGIVISVFMMAACEAIYTVASGVPNTPLALGIFLQMFAAILGAYILMTLTHFVSGVSSAIYTIVFLLVGYALPESYLYFEQMGYMSVIAHSLYYILPNFSFFEN